MLTKSIKSLSNKLASIRAYNHRDLQIYHYPLALNIETSSMCNLRCPQCSRESGGLKRKTGVMDRRLFEKIVNEVHENCELVILHNNGEPLMNEHLPEMISYAKQHHLTTVISTNVTLLNNERATSLIEAGLDIIILAVDGSTSETYEKIRIGANYKSILRNIKNLLEKKKELERKNPFVVLQLIEMEQNRHEIPKFKQYWSGYPVTVFIKPSTDFGGKVNVSRNCPCDRLWHQSVVLSDGRLVPCCMDMNGDYSLGSVKDNMFFDIWNGSQMRSIRKKENQNKFELCKTCNYISPRRHNSLTDLALLTFNMGFLARVLYSVGYTRKSQL